MIPAGWRLCISFLHRPLPASPLVAMQNSGRNAFRRNWAKQLLLKVGWGSGAALCSPGPCCARPAHLH